MDEVLQRGRMIVIAFFQLMMKSAMVASGHGAGWPSWNGRRGMCLYVDVHVILQKIAVGLRQVEKEREIQRDRGRDTETGHALLAAY